MRAVNLIPVEQRTSTTSVPGHSEGAVYIVLVAIAGLALLVFLYGSARHQVDSKRSEAASLTEQAQSVEAEANRLAPYASFVTLHNERVQGLAQLVGTRFDWAHAFRELGRVLPTNVSLSTVQGTIGASTPGSSSSASAPAPAASAAGSTAVSSATPPGSVPMMTLSGCTVSQSEVAVTLARLRLIDGVADVELQSSTKSSSSSGSSASTASTSGPCPPGGPTFGAQITFAALPSPPTGGAYGSPTMQVVSTSTFAGAGSTGRRGSRPSGGSTSSAKRSGRGPAATISANKTTKGSR
jgi:Tfp pilus assembly protein PilN